MQTLSNLPQITASHLVKSVNLNHHGTLYAGQMAEWLVEVGFMTARAALRCDPSRLVCIRLHGMDFRKSVPSGATLVIAGRVAYVGRSSLSVHIAAHPVDHPPNEPCPAEGFVTFVHLEAGRATPHGLEVAPPEEGEARRLWDYVLEERKRR